MYQMGHELLHFNNGPQRKQQYTTKQNKTKSLLTVSKGHDSEASHQVLEEIALVDVSCNARRDRVRKNVNKTPVLIINLLERKGTETDSI